MNSTYLFVQVTQVVNPNSICMFVETAYRIHVHQSTVKVLRELNLGYKLELRSRTEVRVKHLNKNTNNNNNFTDMKT